MKDGDRLLAYRRAVQFLKHHTIPMPYTWLLHQGRDTTGYDAVLDDVLNQPEVPTNYLVHLWRN